ncbi:hypothetical protein BKA69DRAFT_1171526 [Paraphysoderma sedebokerense]|nr:hypothetical protein BKA69DRAFT_1171526 [Paraphysoderma sedebokerense]
MARSDNDPDIRSKDGRFSFQPIGGNMIASIVTPGNRETKRPPIPLPPPIEKLLKSSSRDDDNDGSTISKTDKVEIPYPWHIPYLTPNSSLPTQSIKPYNIVPPYTAPPEILEPHEFISIKVQEFLHDLLSRNPHRPKIIFYHDLLQIFERSVVPSDADSSEIRHSAILSFLEAVTKAQLDNTLPPFAIITPKTETKPSVKYGTDESGLFQVIRSIRSARDEDELEDDEGAFMLIEDENSTDDDDKGSALRVDGHSTTPPSIQTLINRSKTTPRLDFKTPLDKYLGVSVVPILPTGDLHSNTATSVLRDFRRQLDKDYRQIVADSNLIEFGIAAQCCGISLPYSFEDIFICNEESTPPLPVLRRLSGVSSQFLAPVQIEKILSYTMSSILSAPASPSSIPITSDNSLKVTLSDFENSLSRFFDYQDSFKQFMAPATFGGLLSQGKDEKQELSAGAKSLLKLAKAIADGKAKLSQHEETILKQCLVMPGNIRN